MFVKAIKKNILYTKPLLTGKLFYEDLKILNYISTLMVLNDDGDILTCLHVAELFMNADETNEVFKPILQELSDKSAKETKKILIKYGINDDTLVGMHNILVDIAENPGRLNVIKHPYLDLAIIRLENKKKLLVKSFPIFRNPPEMGESICKLGFAFPEYDTFYYDEKDFSIKTNNRIMNFPIFPLDGMVSRNVIDMQKEITMFETTSPALPGQSGAPIFDKNGYVCGIQIGTKRISSSYNNEMPFNIDLGVAINSKAIMDFLDKNQIKYNKLTK